MTIVSLTANAMSMTMATALGFINILFYDSNKTIVGIILHIFTSFCFGNDNSEFDSKYDVNKDGNGSGNDLS
jgi:hypothetical protein